MTQAVDGPDSIRFIFISLDKDDLLNMVINFPDGIFPVCSVMYAYTHEQDSSVRIPDLFNIMVAGPWTGITYKPSTGDLIVLGD